MLSKISDQKKGIVKNCFLVMILDLFIYIRKLLSLPQANTFGWCWMAQSMLSGLRT